MFALKPISHESVAGALAKAERYRLLNEPAEAESICRDILELEPDNADAQITIVLALTDQISHDSQAFSEAIGVINRMESAYHRAYYAGIAWERRAKARFHSNGHGSTHTIYEWIVKAMQNFEEAEKLQSWGNYEAVLRWNTCVRFLDRNRQIAPKPEEQLDPIASE
jgi:hypothetical protein